MNMVNNSSPLILFLVLLFVLSFSIFFGNVKLHESLYTITNEQEKQLEKDLKTINDKNMLNVALMAAENMKTPPTKGDNKPSEYSQSPPNNIKSGNNLQPQNPSSDYYNWLAFWNTVAESNNPSAMFNSSNYIPNPAVIPTVCPKCNINSGVCTGCGGQGGAGTCMQYKNRFSDFLATYGSGYKGDGKWAGYGGRGPTLGQVVDNAGSGVVDVTKTALNNATGLAAGAGLGAIMVAEDAGSGAVGLLKDAASGTKDLLEEAGSGAVSLLKSNPAQINNQNDNNQVGRMNDPYQTGYYSQGTYNLPNNPLGIKGIDPYSYNGALVPKGSNYIPITDDFSSFRK